MKFEDQLKRLNNEQRKVVDTLDGPIMVLAGPGSGKTQVLAMRVANILRETDTSPGSILCLTFTDSASVNMRKRLTSLIGSDAYKVQIHTFHSFGISVINRFSEYFYNGAVFNPADDLVQVEVISQILENLDFNNPLRSEHPEQGFVYLKSTKDAISNLKRAGLTPEDFLLIIESNAKFLEYARPILNKLSGRLKKEDMWMYQESLERLKKYHDPKANEVSNRLIFKTLQASVLDAFSNALELARELDKTTPISDWKKDWMEYSKVDSELYILKEENRIERMRSLAGVYSEYKKQMYQKGYFDFDDMLLSVLEAVEKNDSLKMELQEQFQSILVDEFQDTNEIQLRLLRLLTNAEVNEGRANIMVVGDDDQAIYKFQGAEVTNLQQFMRLYKKPLTVTLNKNYRSGKSIVEMSASVIRQSGNAIHKILPELKKELVSARLEDTDVFFASFETDCHEYEYISAEIERHIKAGISPNEIAVISRKHSVLEEISAFLIKKNIPIQYEHQQNVLELSYIQELITMCRFVNSLLNSQIDEQNDLLVKILSFEWLNIPRLELWKIAKLAKESKCTMFDIILNYPDASIKSFANFLLDISIRAKTEPLERILDLLIGTMNKSEDEEVHIEKEYDLYKSQFREHYFGEKIGKHSGFYINFLSGLRTLISIIRGYKAGEVLLVSDLINMLSVYEKNNIQMTDKSTFMGSKEAVNLLTAHKSKGLEFEIVFVVSALEKVWATRGGVDNLPFPKNLPLKPTSDSMDDYLRLFYVALSRAKNLLYITEYLTDSHTGKEMVPLSFLAHIESGKKNTDHVEKSDFFVTMERLEKPMFKNDEKAFLESLVEDYQMPVTHLNNYLDITNCGPKAFLEQNLLRFPQAKTPSSVFGTAMHAVMLFAQNSLINEKKLPPNEKLIEIFNKYIYSGRLIKSDEKMLLARGENAINNYFAQKSGEFDINDKIERDFSHSGVVLDSVGDALPTRLTGKIDKMRFINDDEVVVYDWKTGKPKTDFETKSGFDAVQIHKYKNQLIFYKILIEHSKEYSDKKVRLGILDFVEPITGTSNLITLPLEILDTDTNRLIDLSRIVYNKIVNLDFPDTTQYTNDIKGVLQFEGDLLNRAI